MTPISAQFRKYADHLVEHSKAVFLKDKGHHEMFFFIAANGEGSIMPAPAKTDRDELATQLRQFVRQNSVFGVIHIAESWTYFPKGASDHTLKQILLEEIGVSNLRPEDRSEMLVVMAEARDGYRKMWMTPIQRDDGKLALGSTIDFDEPPTGRFAGLFEAE